MPIPSWKTELKEVAPNVFAYVQGGGPGIDNHSVSNAGLINGDDSSMVIDALTAPVLTKAFIAAMKKVNPKPFRHLVNTHHHRITSAATVFSCRLKSSRMKNAAKRCSKRG